MTYPRPCARCGQEPGTEPIRGVLPYPRRDPRQDRRVETFVVWLCVPCWTPLCQVAEAYLDDLGTEREQ